MALSSCSQFTNNGVETLRWCEMLRTGGNTPARTVAKSQGCSSIRECSQHGNGPTGSSTFSYLDADSDSRSPPVPTAVQPAIALENLSAENSPGVHFISLILPALPAQPGNRLTEGSLSNISVLSTSGIPHGVLLA